MDKLRIGVIGLGYWGPNLLRNFSELSSCQVIAVADLSEERLNYARSRYPDLQTITQDYRDLFSLNLDAVVISTPPHTHYSIARECLNNRLAVFVEKPLALSSQDALDLCQIAAENDAVLMTGHTFEYNPAVRELRNLITSGELGNVYYINATRVNLGLYSTKFDVIWDLAPHDISILIHLFGTEPVSVSTEAGAFIWKEVADIAYLHLKFPNGQLAHIHVSWLDPQKVRKITVVGDKKMVVYDDTEPLEKLRIYDKGVDAPPYTDTFGEFQLSYRYGNVIIPRISTHEPLRLECEHFVNCIVNHTKPQSDGESGLRVVKVLEAAHKSLEQNGAEIAIAPTPAFSSTIRV